MSDAPFHQTRMGHQFYEATMPELVRQLVRMNENLERLLAAKEGQAEQQLAKDARKEPER